MGRVVRRLHSLAQSPFYDSPLIPGFRTPEQFIADARTNSGHSVQVIDAMPDLWTLGISPGDLAAKALAGLPATMDLIALHTNPGPVHTFVQPDTLEFVGLIDFGDAHIGPPALDWRWPTYQDRLTLLEGYSEESPVSEEFMAAWRGVLVLQDMSYVATRPATRPEALERLRALAGDFE